MTPAVRSYFDRIDVSIDTGEETLVEQSHKEACNINTIVAKAKRTGIMPFANAVATFGDFLDEDDYHSANNKILAANEAFMSLPPALRARFDNDPGQLLSFLSNPANKADAIALGLIPGEPPKADTENKETETPAE